MTFLDLLSFDYLDFQWRNKNISDVVKHILICVSKITGRLGLGNFEVENNSKLALVA